MKHWRFLDAEGNSTGRTMFAPKEVADANCAPGERVQEILVDDEQQHARSSIRSVTQRRIRDVELVAGQRAIREALLKLLPDCPERDRLEAVEMRIAALREQLR